MHSRIFELSRTPVHPEDRFNTAELEMSPTHISVLERGLKAPKLETLVNIANALHVSSDMLLQDVVLYAADGLASELSATISKLSPKEQERVLNAIRALTE